MAPSGQGFAEHVSWVEERRLLKGRGRRTKSGEALRSHFTRPVGKLLNQLRGRVLTDLPHNCWAIFPLFDLSCGGEFAGFANVTLVPNREDKCENDEPEDGENACKEGRVDAAQHRLSSNLAQKLRGF
jgi:hypothetical protein